MPWRRAKSAIAMLRLAASYGAFSMLRRVVSLDRLVRWAWSAPRWRRHTETERELTARVARVSRLVRGRGDCMPRSLVLYRELSKRGAEPQLVVGFTRDQSALVGHAWVVVDGRPIDEPADLVARMTRVCAFGARGRLVDQS